MRQLYLTKIFRLNPLNRFIQHFSSSDVYPFNNYRCHSFTFIFINWLNLPLSHALHFYHLLQLFPNLRTLLVCIINFNLWSLSIVILKIQFCRLKGMFFVFLALFDLFGLRLPSRERRVFNLNNIYKILLIFRSFLFILLSRLFPFFHFSLPTIHLLMKLSLHLLQFF